MQLLHRPLDAVQLLAHTWVMRAHGLAVLLLVSGCGRARGALEEVDAAPGGGLSNGAGGETPGDAAPLLEPEQFEAALLSDAAPQGFADPTGGAWRVLDVPVASNQPELVKTPSGWLALSRRSLGDAKVPSGWETALYRSRDGVRWQLLPLERNAGDLGLRGLAYGAGRYVMVGRRFGAGGGGVIWTSSDGERWTEAAQPFDSANEWRRVVFSGGHFFALGVQYLGVSRTGEQWQSVRISNVQAEAVAYGDGRYVLAGSGPILVSEDGSSWDESLLDCALPGACITDPSGGTFQGYHSRVLFAEGRFFMNELVSADGYGWQVLPGRSPSAYASGYFLGGPSLVSGLSFWTATGPLRSLRLVRPARAAVTLRGRELGIGVLDQRAPLPASVSLELDDGLTCETARCLVVEHQLLMVPPLGTAPLADRVPRTVEGSPLLSDECPVSSTIFCDNYAARSGCVCRAEAPRGPSSCWDVSQYRCEGSFSPRATEWQVEEVGHAGCSCDAVDPNQPAGFGSACNEGGSDCPAPFRCLGIETPSRGLPAPPRFICTSECGSDADCPTWQATGFCAGPVQLRCADGACQPRSCE